MPTRLRPDTTYDRPLLNRLREVLADADPTELNSSLASVLSLLDSGTEVVCLQSDATMTPTQAAEYLGVSRPHIYLLLDRGALPYHNVGRDRRIPSEAIVSYADRRDVGRKQLAETFASAHSDREALVRELAGLE